MENAERYLWRPLVRPHDAGPGLVASPEDIPRMVVKLHGLIIRPDTLAAVGALEQIDTQFVLQRPYGGGNRGLGNVEMLRGSRYAALLDDGDKDLKMAKLHRFNLCEWHQQHMLCLCYGIW